MRSTTRLQLWLLCLGAALGAGLSLGNNTVIPERPSLSTPEAQDMLTSKIKETEKVNHPNVVDNGQTHMEHDNGTDSNKSVNLDQNGEQNCLIPLELLQKCVNDTVNVTLSGNLAASNDSHLLPCKILRESNTSYFDCFIPKELLKDVNSSSHIKCPVQKEIFKEIDGGCPVPRFNCTDKSDENYIISVCTIPITWLKRPYINTWLNCTPDANLSLATCSVSAPKKLNCTTNNMTDTTCLVSKMLASHNFFSKLNCTNSTDASEVMCLFSKKFIQDYKINCIDVQNSTNKICDIPKESFFNDVDKKLNCTSNGENSNLKTCIMEMNVTKPVNSNTSLIPQNKDQHICPIAVEWLNPNITDGLNCTADKTNATILLCRAPSSWMNNNYECPLPRALQQNVTEEMINCTLYYGNSSVIVKCPTSKDSIIVPLINNSTATSQLNISTVSPSSESSNLNNTLNSTNVSTTPSLIQSSTVSPLNVLTETTEIPINKTSNKNDTTVLSPTTEKSHNITTPITLNNKTDEITKKATEISTTKSTTAIPDSTVFTSVTSTATPTQTNGSVAAYSLQHPEVTKDTSEQSTAFLRPTESAAILVGVFIAVAALGYVGLLVWRRVLERRYGNRQLLINEDDDFTNSNNFEL